MMRTTLSAIVGEDEEPRNIEGSEGTLDPVMDQKAIATLKT
jgi:hypothetical protein